MQDHSIGCDMKVVGGDPDPTHVSTSYVQRRNVAVANVHAEIHKAYKCVLKESGQSPSSSRCIMY